jgi:hypothetical protein
MGALGAIAAILAAAPCFHAQKRAQLNLILWPKFQKHTTAFLKEVKEGTTVDLLEFF